MRFGLLTSGGDCAGLNAAIRAVVTRALQDCRVVDAPIAHDHGHDPDDALAHTARGLGIAFGDEVGRD